MIGDTKRLRLGIGWGGVERLAGLLWVCFNDGCADCASVSLLILTANPSPHDTEGARL
jgi:hypothetical protein